MSKLKYEIYFKNSRFRIRVGEGPENCVREDNEIVCNIVSPFEDSEDVEKNPKMRELLEATCAEVYRIGITVTYSEEKKDGKFVATGFSITKPFGLEIKDTGKTSGAGGSWRFEMGREIEWKDWEDTRIGTNANYEVVYLFIP